MNPQSHPERGGRTGRVEGWQVRAQTPTGYVYADGEATYWAFTVGSAPTAEAGVSGPSAGHGPLRRPAAEPSAGPIRAPLAIALLTLMGVLGLHRQEGGNSLAQRCRSQ